MFACLLRCVFFVAKKTAERRRLATPTHTEQSEEGPAPELPTPALPEAAAASETSTSDSMQEEEEKDDDAAATLPSAVEAP